MHPRGFLQLFGGREISCKTASNPCFYSRDFQTQLCISPFYQQDTAITWDFKCERKIRLSLPSSSYQNLLGFGFIFFVLFCFFNIDLHSDGIPLAFFDEYFELPAVLMKRRNIKDISAKVIHVPEQLRAVLFSWGALGVCGEE